MRHPKKKWNRLQPYLRGIRKHDFEVIDADDSSLTIECRVAVLPDEPRENQPEITFNATQLIQFDRNAGLVKSFTMSGSDFRGGKDKPVEIRIECEIMDEEIVQEHFAASRFTLPVSKRKLKPAEVHQIVDALNGRSPRINPYKILAEISPEPNDKISLALCQLADNAGSDSWLDEVSENWVMEKHLPLLVTPFCSVEFQ